MNGSGDAFWFVGLELYPGTSSYGVYRAVLASSNACIVVDSNDVPDSSVDICLPGG